MCLLIHKPADVDFEKDALEDFYKRNDDGFGIMYYDAKFDRLRVVKKPDATLQMWLDTYAGVAKGKECLIHLRMRTHGDIDFTNTHPYPVIRGLWMMHNGILSTGNDADKSKSDTWHFINDYLKPILTRDPDMIFEEAFQKLVSEAIGKTNKFAFMDARGRIAIINKESGREWKGAWMSNSYAWSAWNEGAASYAGTFSGGRYGNWYRGGYYENMGTGYADWDEWPSPATVQAGEEAPAKTSAEGEATTEADVSALESAVSEEMPEGVQFFIAALEAGQFIDMAQEFEDWDYVQWLYEDSPRDFWDFAADIENRILSEQEIAVMLGEIEGLYKAEKKQQSWFEVWKAGLAGK